MSPKFLNIEILFIYFLLLIPWPHTHVIKFLCSRDSSRLVRKIVRSKWTPILDKHHAKLPLECPFHPLRDVYAPRQDAKKRDRPTQWTCRLCGKSFYQEKFLDLHFEIRHKSVINKIEDSVCLADYCDIMRCDVFQTEDASSLKFGDQQIVTDIEVWGQNSALAKANAAYLSLLPLRASALGGSRPTKVQNRQLYQENVETSARQTPTTTTEANIIETGQKIKAKIDATLKKVTGGSTRVESDSSSHTTTASTEAAPHQDDTASLKHTPSNSDELNAKNETSNNSTVSSNSTTQEDTGNTTNAQKGRMPCKPEELSKLKAKCEAIVRGCIASLILSMSDKAFKEVEEEMNKAVCWYLTCDRYWEDGPLEPRAFPWGLIVILILALSIGICFCYYIIWILFDSEEMTINSNQQQQQQQQQQMYGYMPQQLGHDYHDDYHDYHMTDPQQQQQQHYYYQQQQQQQQQMSGSVHDLYPEQAQYDYRHSPRHHYIGDQHQPGTPILGQQHMVQHDGGARTTTPLHHHPTNLAYQQDILDRRDYTNSRPLATTAVTSSGSSVAINTTNIATGTPTATSSGSHSGSLSRMHTAAGEQLPGNRYNTHPRQLESRHRHVGASQQSLRASSSTHEIIQNEIGNNEHYIYVTYPPDLKKRFFEKYE